MFESKTSQPSPPAAASASATPATADAQPGAALDALVFGLFTRAAPVASGAAAGTPPPATGVPASPGASAGDGRAPHGLIVDDGLPAGEGRTHLSSFLDAIGPQIERVVDEELGGVGLSARDCPYLEHWLRSFRERPAAHLERALRLYARPERGDLDSVREAVLRRARESTREWLDRRSLTGVLAGLWDEAIGDSDIEAPAVVRRKPEAGAEAAPPAAGEPARVQARLGPGRPLDPGLRTRMEQGLERDLRGVRVHHDGAAAGAARDLHARAFTVGDDVGFAAGAFRPGTLAGDALLAHELAHATQPENLTGLGAEREADAAAARVLGVRLPGVRDAGAGGGALRLRRCGEPAQRTPEQELADKIKLLLGLGGGGSPAMLEALRKADPDVLAGGLAILRLSAESEHTTYYLWLIQELERGLDPKDWTEVQQLLGLDPLSGSDRIQLSAQAQALLTLLRVHVTTGNAAGVLTALKGAAVPDAEAALTVLHRTSQAEHGNQLFRLQAMMRKSGTPDQYRDFVRFLHETNLSKALDEADPRLGLIAEREAALNRKGESSGLSDDEMAGLFAARAREMAHTMLRDSERQLIGVLTRSEGGGGESSELDADADRAVAVLNKNFKPTFALKGYDDFAAAVRPKLAAAGQTVSDDQLRRAYNRERQIVLYRLGAARDALVVHDLTDLDKQIAEHEEWFRTPKIIQGNIFIGPAWEMRERQRIADEAADRNAALNKLKPKRDALRKVKSEVEGVLPLLGGLDEKGLKRLADLPGGAREFDQILRGRLSEILGNIVEARRLLHSGDVSVWRLPPVVAATRRAMGIPDTPENDTQKRWDAVVKAQVQSAKEDAERTRKILEILNAGALIAALGTALFTGGGSLALYVGVGGIALGLGTSVYDVVDASRRTHEAETFYGSGLTEGLRLSDVPPDYRFLHMAWIGLGVNVVLSAFCLRGLGKALAATLQGEEAAVRAEALKLVRRLRAAGATQSEDELLQATLAALREQGWVTGAVRGAGIYDVHPTRREWLTGAGRSLETQVDQVIAGQPRVRGATVVRSARTVPPPAPPPAVGPAAPAAPAAGVPGASIYEMSVPTPKGPPIKVDVTFSAHPEANLPAGPHGAASGPARLQLRPNADGSWSARVHVHEGLRPESFPYVMGHELDEIAGAVARLPAGATEAQIGVQLRARVFRPGSIGAVTALSAHDEAALEELRRAVARLNAPGLTTPQRTAAQLRLERQLEAMGLRDATDIGVRVGALRAAGLDAVGLDVTAVERSALAGGEMRKLLGATPLSQVAATGRAGATIIDQDLIEHLMYMKGREGSSFVKMGVQGGHVTSELQAFERANPKFAFVETSPKTPQPGRAGYHRYEQYLWDEAAAGSATPPAVGSPARPGGSAFNPAHWNKSIQLKTTADDLQKMLLEMEDAFAKWRNANPTLATTQEQWGRGLTPAGASGSNPSAVSAGGVEFSGYFTYTPATSTTPATWRIRTGFVEGSWF